MHVHASAVAPNVDCLDRCTERRAGSVGQKTFMLTFSVYRVESHHPLHRTSNVASCTLYFLHADPHDAIDEESTLHTATCRIHITCKTHCSFIPAIQYGKIK